MEKTSFFNSESKKDDNVIKQTGRGILTVGTVVGAGILVGMGFNAFKGASESI